MLLLVASLIGALVTGRDLFYNLLYLWLALVAVAGLWSYTSLGQARVARQTRALRAQVGNYLEERLAVRNSSRLPKLWLEVRDQSDMPGHQASKVIVALAPGRDRLWTVRTLCRQRGRYRLGPITVISGDPFGLFQVTRDIKQSNQIVVYPLTVELPDFPLPLGITPGGEFLRRRTHYVTPNAAGVREYVSGDSFNRIHWRTTARRNRLMVKEFELDPMADIWVLLDGDQSMQAGQAVVNIKPDDFRWFIRPEKVTLLPSTEEYAVSIAGTIAQHFIRRDRAVGLIAYGDTREVIQPDRGERQFTKLLETLAVFRAHSRVRLNEALTLESDQLPRGSTVAVITATWDVKWATIARGLKRRGVNVVAVILNPASFGGQRDNAGVAAALWSMGMPAYSVNEGDDLAAALTASKG